MVPKKLRYNSTLIRQVLAVLLTGERWTAAEIGRALPGDRRTQDVYPPLLNLVNQGWVIQHRYDRLGPKAYHRPIEAEWEIVPMARPMAEELIAAGPAQYRGKKCLICAGEDLDGERCEVCGRT